MLKINRPLPADRIRLLIFDLDGTLVDSRVNWLIRLMPCCGTTAARSCLVP